MKKFVIIDGNNICYRSFYALPMLQNFEGVISNAVFGFANTLTKIIELEKPDYIAVAFDKGKKTFRHQMYADYKAQRKPTPKELISQIPLLKEMLDTMKIKYLEHNEIEADDIIGVLSRKFDTENIIVSADRDVLQLINDNTTVYAPQKGGEAIYYTEEKLKEIMGITPLQIIELKSLMGDTSDNIPGVGGIGEKTALGLVTKYGDLDNVYNHIDELTAKQQEKLMSDKDDAYFSKQLATIITDFDLDVELEDFTYQYPFSDTTRDFFKQYQFNSLLKKSELFVDVEGEQNQDEDNRQIEIITTAHDASVALDAISKMTDMYIYLDDKVFSISDGEAEYNFAIESNLIDYFTPLEEIVSVLKNNIENNAKLYLYDAKDFLSRMSHFGVQISNIAFDCLIAKYLINSNQKAHDFANAIVYFALPKYLLSKNIYQMTNLLQSKLKELELDLLYYDVELPLIKVLFDMEGIGVKVDVEELKALDVKYQNLVEETSKDIYEMAGMTFNINSPKQLAEVLFDKLELKTKTHKKESTKASVLNELIGQHPIVQKIIDYRQYFKLHSTYIKSYMELIDNDNRLHTIFQQAVTATGRLSSTEPNLQNIPTRSEEGKALRKLFIPTDPNGMLISADYSQIELRLLADFSGDDRLINAYNTGKDIHALTASEIFGMPIEMVSDQMRRSAKAINFGIIYGISDWGLSQNIGITKNEAGEYIKTYFVRYPKVEGYMNGNVEYAREHGYIRTLMNRIRFIPELKASNKMQQLFGERVAMNMPLQGSAADIMKLAMVKVYDRFIEEGLRSKLILQVHDELIVDTVAGEEDKVESILRDCMENVVNLRVRLEVNVGRGKNLSEAK